MSEYYTLGSWDSNGVPNYLYDVETLDPNIINRIFTVLPEKQSVPDNAPQYITSTSPRNLIIKSTDPEFTGADVYVSFVFEGAGYKNVVGYYVYPLNNNNLVPTKLSEGSWVPMTYNDRNSVDANGKSILKKTVIYPNASLPTWANNNGKNPMAGGGNLLPGSRVKLLYDINNPLTKFPNNTGIGFFLIPNGWNSSTKKFSNTNPRVYTDSTFNTDNSVQTILLYDSQNSDDAVGTDMILAFEDIMLPGGDKDYNDVIIKIRCDPASSAYNINSSIVLNSSDPVTEDNIVLDRTGMYYQLTDTTLHNCLNSSATTFHFAHTIKMTNEYEQYNTLKQVLENFNKSNGAYIETDNTEGLRDSDERQIRIKMDVPKGNLQNNMYIINSYNNIEKTSPINPNVSALVEFQSIYKSNTSGTIKNLSFTLTDNNSTSIIDNTTYAPVTRNLNSPFAMGDPYITTIFGDKYMMPNKPGIYELYNDTELIINTTLDYFPRNKNLPVFKDLTFLHYVSISLNKEVENKFIIVNMFHKDTYCTVKNGSIVELSKDELVNYPEFEILSEEQMENSSERRKYYSKIMKSNMFHLRYIKISTHLLGNAYIELLYMPHRKDYVNSISIINNNMYMVNAKGGMVYKKMLKEINDLV